MCEAANPGLAAEAAPGDGVLDVNSRRAEASSSPPQRPGPSLVQDVLSNALGALSIQLNLHLPLYNGGRGIKHLP